MQDKKLGYSEAAQLIGIAVGTLYSWVHKRQVPHIRLGSRLVRFSENELVRWLSDKQIEERVSEKLVDAR